MTEYLLNLAVMAGIAALSAAALNLLIGYVGVFSSAQAAMYGVGGYAGAQAALHWSTSLFVVLPVGVVAAVIVSVLLALPASRLTGEYFVVASMAFATAAYTVFANWTKATGGPVGLVGVPQLSVFGIRLVSESSYLIVTLVSLALVLVVCWFVARVSPLGRSMAALRDDPVAAQGLGVPPFRTRMIAVAISSGMSGLAGAIYACYIGYINADSFSIDASILFFAMVILGGAGTIWGPVIGAVFVTGIPAIFDNIGLSPQLEGPVSQLLYGVAIVVLMMVKPSGLITLLDDLRRVATRKELPADEESAVFAEGMRL
jgi:branched-chain amino acid transport system permease protein